MFVNLGFASADNYMWSETFLILLAMGRNILFLHTAHKVRTVRPAGEKQPTHFTLLVEEISIYTT